ncbi:RDD family protein [Streptomyces sp. NPDC001546]|uniref:RDD family protein n=1 Tax=Streptomyces sp. NPDC001546 TaxID=3364585 RepID=UPI003683CDA8
MSTDQPPPGQPPDDDPFLKKPQEPTPPANGSPYGQPPPGSGGGYPPPPPPPPYGGGGGDPYGHGGPGPYGYGMPDPLAGMPPLPSAGKRLGARIIDLVLVGIVSLVILGVAVAVTYRGDDTSEISSVALGGAALAGLVSLLVYVLYDWLMTRAGGQTLGKKLVGLRVAMLNDGSRPTTGVALGRALVLWWPTLSLLVCGPLGFGFPTLWLIVIGISILVDKPYQQGWHDKAAKTVVVTVT